LAQLAFNIDTELLFPIFYVLKSNINLKKGQKNVYKRNNMCLINNFVVVNIFLLDNETYENHDC